MLLLLLLLPLLRNGGSTIISGAELPACSLEEQIIMCGQLPLATAEELAAYGECCEQHDTGLLPPEAHAATAQAAAATAQAAASTLRPDLNLTSAGGRYASAPNYFWNSTAVVNGKRASTCVAKGSASVPTFTTTQQVTVKQVTAPLLTTTQITRVKARSLSSTNRATNGQVRRMALRPRSTARRMQSAATTYVHPAALMGPSELALMHFRINASISPQAGALTYMLSGATVPPKYYRFNGSIVWNPPTDCPVSWLPGPYAMAEVNTK